MGTEDRGFASIAPERQREIASKGGRAAHVKGTAHEWTREEAAAAGRKGGLAMQARLRAQAVAREAAAVSQQVVDPVADVE